MVASSAPTAAGTGQLTARLFGMRALYRTGTGPEKGRRERRERAIPPE
jgi:hypothetical protein